MPTYFCIQLCSLVLCCSGKQNAEDNAEAIPLGGLADTPNINSPYLFNYQPANKIEEEEIRNINGKPTSVAYLQQGSELLLPFSDSSPCVPVSLEAITPFITHRTGGNLGGGIPHVPHAKMIATQLSSENMARDSGTRVNDVTSTPSDNVLSSSKPHMRYQHHVTLCSTDFNIVHMLVHVQVYSAPLTPGWSPL